jgi:hypothetical protein
MMRDDVEKMKMKREAKHRYLLSLGIYIISGAVYGEQRQHGILFGRSGDTWHFLAPGRFGSLSFPGMQDSVLQHG